MMIAEMVENIGLEKYIFCNQSIALIRRHLEITFATF